MEVKEVLDSLIKESKDKLLKVIDCLLKMREEKEADEVDYAIDMFKDNLP